LFPRLTNLAFNLKALTKKLDLTSYLKRCTLHNLTSFSSFDISLKVLCCIYIRVHDLNRIQGFESNDA